MVQCARGGHDNAHDRYNDRKDRSAQGVAGECVQYFGASEDVEADEEDVVCHQHEGREGIGSSTLSENIKTEIALKPMI